VPLRRLLQVVAHQVVVTAQTEGMSGEEVPLPLLGCLLFDWSSYDSNSIGVLGSDDLDV